MSVAWFFTNDYCRALKAGIKCPLLILPTPCDAYPQCDLVALLGALEALYVVRIKNRRNCKKKCRSIFPLIFYNDLFLRKFLDQR